MLPPPLLLLLLQGRDGHEVALLLETWEG